MSLGLALGLGSAISAGGSIIGGVLAKKGAESQATAAEEGTRLSIEEQRRQFDITQKNLAPWQKTGEESIRMLAHLMGWGQRRAARRGNP